MTDNDGKYSLSVPNDTAVLVFSYLGFRTQEVKVGGRSVIDVILEDEMESLDEVVVVGYGTVKKANLTGAVDQVKGSVMESRPITSVTQALQGMIANLNITTTTDANYGGGAPGAKMNINVRGVTGITGTSGQSAASPLIVVDGIQGQDINNVNPDDIESISVLKDAASSAIYGSNAPFGVILITTKKGRKNVKPTVSYSNNFGWAAPINIPEMVNSVQWAKLTNEATQHESNYDFVPASAVLRMQDYLDGKLTATTIPTANGREWAGYDPDFGNDNNDWFKVFLKTAAFAQQHNGSVSGGTANTDYYLGLGYMQKDGLYRYGDDSYNRYSLRTNLSSRITGWLTTNVRVSYTRGVTNSPNGPNDGGTIFHNIARLWPVMPLYNPDGRVGQHNWITVMEEGGRNILTEDMTVLTGETVITPVKGWSTTFNYTFNNGVNNRDRDILHTTAYRPNGEEYPGQNQYDYLTRWNSRDLRHTVNLFSSYERNIGDHYLKGMLGFSQESFANHFFQSTSGQGNLYSVEVPVFGAMYGNTPGVAEERYGYSSRGVFGRINYGYAEKYLLELNGRYDGSSRFLEDVRYKFYPGVSAAWVVSKEKFWKPVSGVADMFKVRASYGALGDISFLNSDNYSYPLYFYPFYPSLGTTPSTSSNWLYNGSRDAYITSPGIINTALTWVTSTTIDFGADAALFNNRLSATFDWYQRKSNDLVGPAEQLPAVVGASAPKANNASMTTRGFELTLSWKDRIGDFSYGIRATLADSKSVIDKFPNENKAIGNWYDGKTVGELWGFVTEGFYTVAEETAGISQDRQKAISGNTWRAGDIKYADLNGDGVITTGESTVADPGDRKIIGNSESRYTYGITLDAAWKGFDLNAFFQGVGKRDTWYSGNYFWGFQGHVWGHSLFTKHLDRWTPETPNAYFPNHYSNISKNQQVQTKYLQNAAYLRLKNLQLGYSIPGKTLSKIGISKLRLYVSGENLFTISKMIDWIDPDLASTNGKIYPLQRTWSLGLNLTF
jgi:TonB-linked SusC/RagA family outer membrane protein